MHTLRVVVCHCLQGIDKVNKFETSVHILVVPLDVVHDVRVLQLLGALVLREKHSQVVRVDHAVGVLVDYPEDRQDRVIEAANKLLLEKFHALEALDFFLDDFEYSILHFITKLCLLETVLEVALGCPEVLRVGVRSWAQNLHQATEKQHTVSLV